MAASSGLGVTVVAGFLGAGKTTLVNHLLHNAEGRRLGIMVNDFGALNIDETLIDERRDDLIALSNGCVCCSLQGELSSSIESMIARRGGQLDHLLIECSGVSDPERVINVLHYPRIRARARLESVITLVDAALDYDDLNPALRHLVASQIENADLVVINKCDLAAEQDIVRLEQKLLLPDSRHVRATQAALPTDFVFWPVTVSGTPSSRRVPPGASPATSIEALGLKTLSWQHPGSVNLAELRALLDNMPGEILRFKGVVHLGDGRTLALQRAAGKLTSRELEDTNEESRLVFIGADTPLLWESLSTRLERLADDSGLAE